MSVPKRVDGHTYSGFDPGNWDDPLDFHKRHILSAPDAKIRGDDPPSDGYGEAVEGGEQTAGVGALRIKDYRLLAIGAGAAVTIILTMGAIAMSMLPEIVKNLGPEGALVALAIILSGGGAVTYFFWRYTVETQKQYVELVQQALREARTRAREQHEAYERGRLAEREAQREDSNRTPPEGTRITGGK